jgi:hypothetical protein
VASTAVTPAALATAQTRQPSAIPVTAAIPAARPDTAVVRRTSIVSRPGVMARIAANTANAAIPVIRR